MQVSGKLGGNGDLGVCIKQTVGSERKVITVKTSNISTALFFILIAMIIAAYA
jgi:hypothetical protein